VRNEAKGGLGSRGRVKFQGEKRAHNGEGGEWRSLKVRLPTGRRIEGEKRPSRGKV